MSDAIKEFFSIMLSSSHFLIGVFFGLFLGIFLPIVDIISVYFIRKWKGNKNEKGD